VNPFRFGTGRPLPRWVAGAILCGVAAGVPILPAIAIGTMTTAWPVPVIWAIGAAPALLLALLLALRPRTADEVAGYAMVEVFVLCFSYLIVIGLLAGDR
jgi:hypothetical protein